MVQDIDVFVAFFVFAGGKFRGHPIAVAFGIKGRHVDLGLPFHHQLRKVITGATRRSDAK